MTIQTIISPALEAFGVAVKAARVERDWPLSKLALEALGNEDRKGYCSQVEKGRRKLSEGTILNFARALDLPALVTDPLLGNVLPQTDDTTETDAAASAILKEAEALRDKLKLSEALAIALAYKYADGNPTDMIGALKGLEAALELAAKEKARGTLPSNFDSAVDQIVARVAALNQDGEIDQAYAELQAERARRRDARAQQIAEDARVLDLVITQATYANDAAGLAEATLEQIQLDAPSAEDSFHRLQDAFRDRYEDGLRYGTPFALIAAAGLARKAREIAPNADLRAMAENDLGATLSHHGTRSAGAAGNALLAEAVAAFRAALRVRTEAAHPVDWAMTQQNLGIALETQGSRTAGAEGNALLAEAVAAFRAALRVRTEAAHPVDWAMTQQNLGIALETQGSRTAGAEGNALLAEAVAAYRAALRVRTEAAHPVHWAMTQQNLGGALETQGSRTAGAEGNALLAEAVAAYRAALRVRTEAAHPVDWAMTQQNLGGALQTQGSRTAGAEGNALLAEAVAAYRAALRVRTEAAHPVDWAMTQQNLGVALQTQGSRTAGEDGNALLAKAVAAYRAALRVRTEAAHPVQWAMTQENLAIAELTRAVHDTTADPRPHLQAALAHVEGALRVFDPVHMSYNYDKAAELRDHLQDLLKSRD